MRIITPMLLTALVLTASAQDSVKLVDGSKVEGEIRHADESTVRILDDFGATHEVERARVIRLKKGRSLCGKSRKLLEGVDVADAASLFVAIGTLPKRDRKIVARRVLALDAQHAGAHAILDHVLLFDRWFPNMKAVKKELARTGYASLGAGYIWKEDKRAYLQDKDAWVLEGLIWHRREALGQKKWRDVWYEAEAAEMVSVLFDLEERLNIPFHGAQVGGCRVYTTGSPAEARAHAALMNRALQAFLDKVGLTSDRVSESTFDVYLVEDTEQYEAFLDFGPETGLSKSERDRFRDSGLMLAWGYGLIGRVDRDMWDRYMIRCLPQMAMHRASRSPTTASLRRGMGHLVALDVFGHIAGREGNVEPVQWQGHVNKARKGGLRAWRRIARKLREEGSLPTVTEFLGDNKYRTASWDVAGILLLDYFVREQADAFRRFLCEKGSADPVKRLEAAFDMSIDDIDQAFRRSLSN